MTQGQQPEALRLANALAYCDSSVASQAAAELRRQHARIVELENERDRHRDAHREWNDKTDWVQESSQAHELGKHRADVLRERIVRLQSELDAALEVAEANAKSGAAWSARVQELEAQIEAIGDGGVEPLRRRECLHQISEPAPVLDMAVMQLAESVGLIGPASRVHDLHAAIQRFHDLICANATIKAAVMAADAIRGAATSARDYPPLPMQVACTGVFPVYSADQMRAYVDADRAARAPADGEHALYTHPSPPEGMVGGWIALPGTLPDPGTPVLLDIGKKYPIRAMLAAKHTVQAAGDDTDWGEYDEATDQYWCPEGWYEWNQNEDNHWQVSETPRAWMPLPPPPTTSAGNGKVE